MIAYVENFKESTKKKLIEKNKWVGKLKGQSQYIRIKCLLVY